MMAVSSAAEMNYLQAKPRGAASDVVECFWVLEDAVVPDHAVHRIVPDGRSEIILNLSQPFESFGAGHWRSQPKSFFAGQLTAPLLVRPAGPTRTVGIRFQPCGASRVLGMPVRALTDVVAPLDAIAPGLCRALRRLEDLPSDSWFLALDRIFQPFSRRDRRSDPRISAAVDGVIATAGLIDVKSLAGRIGISTRQLERGFRDEVGIAPKTFCRLQRFQRVFQAIETGSSWIEAALECGYYDQAHLIRDFRAFAGETPTTILSAGSDLAAFFLQHRKVSHSSKTQEAGSR